VLPARPLLSRRTHWRNRRRVRRSASGRSVYNYFRDYDPAIGRYVESDPIGLGGGVNTYAYVAGNALRYSDPRGLNPAVGCIAGAWAGPVGCGVGAAIGTAVVGGLALAAIMSTPGDTPKDDGKVVPLFPKDKTKEAEQCRPDDIDPCEELLAALQVRYVQLMSRAAQGIDVTFEVRQYMTALGEFTLLCPELSRRAPKLPPELKR
jgi:RHS repeat-associated protein